MSKMTLDYKSWQIWVLNDLVPEMLNVFGPNVATVRANSQSDSGLLLIHKE